MAKNIIRPGKYRHYKGKMYQVHMVAHHSESLEPLVVYQAMYDSPGFGTNVYWVRPFEMFEEVVEVDGKKVKRFEFIGNE